MRQFNLFRFVVVNRDSNSYDLVRIPGDRQRSPTDVFALFDVLSESPLTPSPYTPPTYVSDKDIPTKFDGDPLDNPRILIWVLRIATLLLVPLGLLGSLGALALLTGDPKNPEAYEVIVAPVYAWLISIPVLIVCFLIYRKCRPDISMPDRLWFNAWSLLPTVALVVAIVASVVRY